MWLTVLLTALGFCGALALWSQAGPRGASILLGAGILNAAEVVLVLLAAGWLGQLRSGLVISLYIALNVGLLASSYRGLFRALRALAVDAREAGREISRSSWGLAALLLALVAFAWGGCLGLLLPPTDYDGLAQFIPTAVLHLQGASLARLDTPYRGILAYPANGSLLIAWLWLTSGSDIGLDLVQWPFWLLGGLGVYKLARLLTANRAAALMGCLVFCLAPVVILQARADLVDLLLAGLVIAALAVLFDQRLALRWRAAVVGAALGLGLGTKYAGVIYAVVVGLLAIGLLAWARRPAWAKLAGDVVALTLPALLLGGSWYFSNWQAMGNPVWPIQVDIGQTVVFPGVWTTQTFYADALPPELAQLSYPAQLWAEWRELTDFYAPDMRLGGLGPLWLTAALPALAVLAVQGLRERRRLGLAVPVLAAAFFVFTPANWHTRYVLLPLALGGVALAALVAQLQGWPRRLLSAFVLVGAGYSFGLVLAFGPITPSLAAAYAELPASQRRPSFSGIVPANDPAMRWFDQNIPVTATVAYSWGSVVLYPFADGNNLRTFVYVAPSQAQWFEALRRRGAEYLITYAGSDEALAAAGDTRFREIFADDRYAIYFLKS